MRASWIDLWLPKFEIREKYKMAKILYGMGMASAFSSAANFTNIDPSSLIYIGEVIHQSFVKAEEEGAEATAATAVIAEPGSSLFGGDESQPEIFHADHPFTYLIRYKTTSSVLFMGRICDPNSSI
jgi:serpin B